MDHIIIPILATYEECTKEQTSAIDEEILSWKVANTFNRHIPALWRVFYHEAISRPQCVFTCAKNFKKYYADNRYTSGSLEFIAVEVSLLFFHWVKRTDRKEIISKIEDDGLGSKEFWGDIDQLRVFANQLRKNIKELEE